MIVGGIFSGILNSVLSSFSSAFAQAATSFLTAMFQAMTAATSLHLSGADFFQEFNAIFGLALVIAILLMLIEIVAGLFARDGKRVTRAPQKLVVMIVGTIISVGLVNTLLQIADSLCVGLIQATHFNVSTTEMVSALAAIATEPAVVLVMAGFMIAACIAIYLSLIARQVLILIAAVLAPLAFSGMTSKWTAGWWRRWAEMMLGLIFSKVILTIILITGFKVMAGMGVQPGHGVTSDPVVTGIGSLIGGVGLLMAGAFAPMFAMKMVHFTGGQFEGAAAMGKHFLSAAAAPIQKAGKLGAAYATGGVSAAATAATGMSMGGSHESTPAEAPVTTDGARPSAPPSSGTDSGPSGGGTDGPRPNAPSSPSSGPSAGAKVETLAHEQSVAAVESAVPPREATPVANTPETESPGSQQREVPNEPMPVLVASGAGGSESSAPSSESRVAKAIAQQRSLSADANRGYVAPPAMVQATPQSVAPSPTTVASIAGDNASLQPSTQLSPSLIHSEPPAPTRDEVRSLPSAPSETAKLPGPLALESGSTSSPVVPSPVQEITHE